MLRRPPRSTLFPYTTLSDLSAVLEIVTQVVARVHVRHDAHVFVRRRGRGGEVLVRLQAVQQRSEEHTSELQSLAYLVCRLLLEKKKKRHQACSVFMRTECFS